MTADTTPHDPAIALVTEALLTARREGRPVSSRPAAWQLGSDAAALAVQAAVCAALAPVGDARLRAWKAGAAGVGAPVGASPLPAAGVHQGLTSWPGRAFQRCGIEAEIAFRLARPVRVAPADREVLPLFDAMCVAIEVVDSRWAEGMEAPERLRLADLQSHGALVLGAWQPLRPVEWRRQACEIVVDGRLALGGIGSHACVDPSAVLRGWIAHVLDRGYRLEAGDVVTTGSWGGAVWVEPAAAVTVGFAGLGSLNVRFGPRRH